MKDKQGKTLTLSEIFLKVIIRMENILLEFEVFMLHFVGCIPLHFFRKICYKLGGVKIGKGSTIHTGARFYDPRNIIIGEDSIIGEGIILDGRAQLRIGNHVDIATDVMIYNSEHNVESDYFQAEDRPVIIEDYVFIGPRAIILPGVKIGKGAIIAAGAVVTKEVAPYAIVGGVPAKIIGERKNKNLNYKLGRARWFR